MEVRQTKGLPILENLAKFYRLPIRLFRDVQELPSRSSFTFAREISSMSSRASKTDASHNGHPAIIASPERKQKSNSRSGSKPPSQAFGRLRDILTGAPENGGPLRWGLAVAMGGEVNRERIAMSELGCGNVIPERYRSVELSPELDTLLHRIDQANKAQKPELQCVVDSVAWAYAMPMLTELITESQMRLLLESLEGLWRHCVSLTDASSLARLIGGGELGLVLGWRRKKEMAKELFVTSAECVKQWCDSPEPSIGFAVRGGFCEWDGVSEVNEKRGTHTRVVLASLLRAAALCESVAKRKLKKPQLDTIADLATWVATATRVGGVAAFSTALARDVRDDTARGGLLDQIKLLDPEVLGPAVDAATGRSHSGGRLAWEISLPEAYCHSELGGTAILLPEWDVRRGRVHIDYAGNDFQVQIDGGKLTVIDGPWEILIQVDDQEQAASGPWTSLCEYSDDDVHYLELEQRWTGGVRVQRHFLLIREDRCVLLADAVIRDKDLAPATIRYTSRIKLAHEVDTATESETTEIWLQDMKGKKRGLALSLQSNEWRVGPTAARFDVTPDANLRLEVQSGKQIAHGGSLFAPMWFDFQQRRFSRPRTWRQLTVAEDLRIVDGDQSVAYRIQQGSEQWVVYRMLHGDRTRTFIGKHLLADLYCARFHAGDGNMEDLVTVGDSDDEAES